MCNKDFQQFVWESNVGKHPSHVLKPHVPSSLETMLGIWAISPWTSPCSFAVTGFPFKAGFVSQISLVGSIKLYPLWINDVSSLVAGCKTVVYASGHIMYANVQQSKQEGDSTLHCHLSNAQNPASIPILASMGQLVIPLNQVIFQSRLLLRCSISDSMQSWYKICE